MGGRVIDPTSKVDPSAEIGEDVRIGPFCVIGGGVEIGDRSVLESHVTVSEGTTLGPDNVISPMAVLGGPPQVVTYRDEPTRLVVGSRNRIREFVTMHRGSPKGDGITTVGNDNYLMAYTHIAHDCHVGSNVIFANNATLAGHVEVGSGSTVGALTAVHQFCRVGEHAFIGGGSIVTKDAMPFMKVVGKRPARCFGPNTIGLERKGFSEDRRQALSAMWRILRSPKLNTSQAVASIKEELAGQPDVDQVLAFIESSDRGVVLATG